MAGVGRWGRWLALFLIGLAACAPREAVRTEQIRTPRPSLTASAIFSPPPPSPTPLLVPTFTPLYSPTPPPPSATPRPTDSPIPSATFTPSPFPALGVVISAIGAYLRAGPSEAFPVVGEIGPREAVAVLAYADDAAGNIWYLVETPTGQQAWIFARLVAFLEGGGLPTPQVAYALTLPPSPTPTPSITFTPSATPSVTPTFPPGASARVTGSEGVNLRAGAGYGYEILEIVPLGAPLLLIGRTENSQWYEASTFPSAESSSQQGWVNADFITLNPSLAPLPVTWVGPSRIAGIQCGMNLQPRDGFGALPLDPNLGRLDWVRFPFNASKRYARDLNAAFAYYDPLIAAYNRLGVRVLLVLNQETYGETEGYPWLNMTSNDWRRFSREFADVAGRIAKHYGTQVAAYEIWNESDAEPDNPAAVAVAPADFASLISATSRALRTNAPQATLVLGGLLDPSGRYLSRVRNALGGTLPVDAIGIHPYGRGAEDDSTVFSRFGPIGTVVSAYTRAAPNLPLWITEIGALGDNSPSRWGEAAQYMLALWGELLALYDDRVDTFMWYAWSDAMHPEQKTNGLVKGDGGLKSELSEAFWRVCGG